MLPYVVLDLSIELDQAVHGNSHADTFDSQNLVGKQRDGSAQVYR